MSTPFAVAVLSSSILSGTSLLYASLGELMGERAGIVNLGLEGTMLIGAAVAIAGASATGDPYLGVAIAALAGSAANLLFGYVVIGCRANQLAAGLTLMFSGFGASALIGSPYVGAIVPGLPRLELSGFGSFDALVWLAAPTAFLLWCVIFRTSWGLGLRAVGEDPAAELGPISGADIRRITRRHWYRRRSHQGGRGLGRRKDG
jgi:general nucleoside transport system permease protein